MDNKLGIMHEFSDKSTKSPIPLEFFVVFLVVVGLGIGSGFLLAKINPTLMQDKVLTSPSGKNAIEKGKSYGSSDMGTFKDSTEGTLKEGGVDGEGQFHLERPGGMSQNVYLTSSLVDLSLFVGRKIKVWGETQKAQKAGWLMDVGKVEVLN